jgi:hypothetical protein
VPLENLGVSSLPIEVFQEQAEKTVLRGYVSGVVEYMTEEYSKSNSSREV